MKSITEIFNNDNQLLESIQGFVNKFIGSTLLRKCRITKLVDDITECEDYEYFDNPITRLLGDVKESGVLEKCVSAKNLLCDKILLCFCSASAYLMFKTASFFRDYKKDTFYRFDKMPKANWERLQLETARNVILEIESETKDNHINALAFDDSLYLRAGGKGTELCAKVYDHNDHKMRTGYRMMTGGWTNGESFVPFAQSLLTSRQDKHMVGPDEKLDGRTVQGKRRNLAHEKGTVVVQHMVKEAKDGGIPFDYVLFDTWFSHPAQLLALKKLDVDVIAMIKKNSTKYEWTNPDTGDTQKLNVKEIYSRNKKRPGNAKYLLAVQVTVSDGCGNSMPVKLVYARNHSNRKGWVCFVCTSLETANDQVLRIYTMRWAIMPISA